ncbi:YhzD family protein [Virgibacillus sp. C22-A2]|uniref:YhzD family protein n=1 Tax=Virgibacillus tibetensis TaxID=3042313 RepID=A0ABU6KF52_9BACI|nr:YhzD family protein [Virgibacillus sp. C22-A2]
MRSYVLTVFEQTGEKLLDETFTAASDDEAKEIGQKRLTDEGYGDHTHRCVTPEAKLILFHR